MTNVKVKAYGIINFTRQQYLITQSIVFCILIACFATSMFLDFSNSDHVMLRYLREISIVIIILEIFESIYMFKKFKRVEADSATINAS